jgi:hypothetical protein
MSQHFRRLQQHQKPLQEASTTSKTSLQKSRKTEHLENGGFDALGRFAFSRLCVE